MKREEALTAGEARNIPGGSTTLPAWMPVVENWRNSGSPSCPCPSTAIDPGQLWDRENGKLRATTGPNHRAVILNGCQAETVVGLPWAADSCPWVGKLRTVLPFTVGIRDGVVQLVLTRQRSTVAGYAHTYSPVGSLLAFVRAACRAGRHRLHGACDRGLQQPLPHELRLRSAGGHRRLHHAGLLQLLPPQLGAPRRNTTTQRGLWGG